MKLIPVTSEQATFIWKRAGLVCIQDKNRKYPRAYDGGDYLAKSAGLVTRSVLNKFKKFTAWEAAK